MTDENGFKYQLYDNDYIIYGNDSVGYKFSKKGIYDAYIRNGSQGVLGKPIRNLSNNNTTKIEWQDFENGCIVGNAQKGYYVSMGGIRKVWSSNGFESGILGFPRSDILTDENGFKYQEYDNGYVIRGSDTYGYSFSRQ